MVIINSGNNRTKELEKDNHVSLKKRVLVIHLFFFV